MYLVTSLSSWCILTWCCLFAALRLLARRSHHFFQPSTNPFKTLPEYLDSVVHQLAQELPVRKMSPTVFTLVPRSSLNVFKTNLFRWTLIITQHPAFLQCNTPAVADPGEGPGGTGAPAPHLFLDQTNRPKKSLMETPPPLSKGLDDRPLPSPSPLISSSRSGTGQ